MNITSKTQIRRTLEEVIQNYTYLHSKVNCKRKIWAERSVVLDEVDPAIRANLETRSWLSLLKVDHPPLTALIREFFSNLSCHVYNSNTLVWSWIRGVEFTITLQIVAEVVRVSVVRELVYPYDKSPPLDDVMSYITGSSIQWGSDPRIISAELTETTYLFFRITCHSLWPISHLSTIPLEQCVFLYAFVSSAFISFPHLFLCSLNEVHRSFVIAHALIHAIFIHRILLFPLLPLLQVLIRLRRLVLLLLLMFLHRLLWMIQTFDVHWIMS